MPAVAQVVKFTIQTIWPTHLTTSITCIVMLYCKGEVKTNEISSVRDTPASTQRQTYSIGETNNPQTGSVLLTTLLACFLCNCCKAIPSAVSFCAFDEVGISLLCRRVLGCDAPCAPSGATQGAENFSRAATLTVCRRILLHARNKEHISLCVHVRLICASESSKKETPQTVYTISNKCGFWLACFTVT